MTVTVSGHVDAHSAPVLRDRLMQVVDAGERRVEVHLDPVTLMDSTGAR